MKKFTAAAGFFTAGLLCCLLIMAIVSFNNKNSRQNPVANFTAPPLPETMSFAGEPVPMDRWEVKEQFDRELLYNYYQPGNILYIMKLAERHFPDIETILKANNVPDDFKYLCVAESNLQNLISKVGATGFWQFMSGTAPGYNLEVSSTVDERYHVAKSTQAACDYLKQAYNRFGNWTAAAASYNCGMGGYSQRSTAQGSNNYYNLVLPEETQRYIFRILTFKHLLSNASALGYRIDDSHRYPPVPVTTITITQNIPNLVSFANSHGTNYKVLKILNPWLRGNSLQTRPGKTYKILIPGQK